jgi:PAS domain S-box-containing protein
LDQYLFSPAIESIQGDTVSRLFEALRDAGDGAFVTDENLRIEYWNESAEEILNFDMGDVADQFCYRVLQGRDEEKRLICKAHCQVAASILQAEPVSNYDIRVRTKQGDWRWVNMSVYPYTMGEHGDKYVIVHLFRDVDQKKEDERFFRRLVEVARKYHDIPSETETKSETSLDLLTPREREVLTLLAKGHGTRDIGQLLSISPNTVRNHIQNILRKLQVHTRLEAVTYAIRHGLID